MEKIPVKLQYGNAISKKLLHSQGHLTQAYIEFKNVTQRSTSNLAEILMMRTSLPIK